ncbi:MAG: GDP-mannose 4,6-dehydratase [Thermodesulfobacteriota bacterium]
MRTLITGGAGFIGSHLAERLLAAGHLVDVIDDLSTGSLANIETCLANPGFSFVNDTVLNEKMMYPLIERADVIYHLAAAVGVELIVTQPVRTIETNIKGTEVVLDVARKFGRSVLVASTSEIYGKNEKVPFREDDDSLFGCTGYSRWSYACSKAIDEFLALAYHREFGLRVVITRFFNTVGERQTGQYGMVIPRFVKAALAGEPIVIHGDGRQSRCFGYVGDVIDGITALMDDPGAFGEVYNIGSTEEITIEDLAGKIVEMTGSSSEIGHIPYDRVYGPGFDDMRRRVPSVEKIEKRVGWKARTSLDEILSRVIEYYRGLEG